ncbi:hypothetical protein BUALT_Bualt01G0221600 [Buddleja alternifolia]|uniref:Ionotropic glutamate receptor C-terminal domain-containing protein n=1 Tax=Buddleja alternifolia TaxID=168488 RepID=A0AAV6YFP1_9LAMI|nr:hypothetical protein BUALT_Bualt01G0221600 [Buddleja alternifolia]
MDFLLLFFSVALLLLPFCTVQSSSNSTVDFQVGIILDLDSPVGRIGNHCLSMAHYDFYSAHQHYKTRLVLNVRDSKGSVLDAAAAALDLLQHVKVDAIIGPQKSTQVNFVMDLGDKADVPIISFSATSPSLIPRTPYFVQTAQSDANQVQAIASIVKAFQWSQVVIIYEDTEFGNGIMPHLSNALQDVNVRVSYRSVFPQSASDDFVSKELYKMMTMQTRVFVVHVTQSLGTKLFLKARELGMMSDGYAWIATSGLTDLFNLMDSNAVEAMQGVLGVKPLIPKSKQLQHFANRWIRNFLLTNQDLKPSKTSIFGLWAYDTLWALAMAAERVGNSRLYATENESTVDSESGCLFTSEPSETGPNILKELLKTKFVGIAGEFNLVNEQLELTPYQIVNVVGRDEKEVGIWTPSGGISKELNLNMTTSYSISKENFKSIIWPGDSIIAPRGWEVPVSGKKLRIGVPQKPGFNEFLKVENDPVTNATKVTGYFKEVFDSVMAALPYAIPYEYTTYPSFNADGSRAGSYDNLVYQVSLQENYDAALGDITITSNRSVYVDFTLPYAEGGITSMVRVKYEDVNDIFTFLQPLTKELWFAIATFYISTALAIWVLGNRIITSSRDSPGQHAGMFGYFPFFPGEGINGNLLCLVLVTWAFVASLLNSTYTASLSSRLTAQRLLPTVTDVTKLIKSGDYVGCQEGSFLVNFLIKSGFDEKKIRTYKTSEDCYEALELGSKSGGISAYYDVVPHLKMLVSQSCGKYRMDGSIHRTDGFAFAFPKGSPVVADISRAIIQLTEKGIILEIEERLSSNLSCSGQDSNSSPTSVTLRSFVVLFAITGFVTLTCLLVSLLMYLSKNQAFLQRMSELNAIVLSRIDALHNYFRESNASSRPKTTIRSDIPCSKEMEFLLLFLSAALLLLPFCTMQSSSNSILEFQVGVVLDLDSPVGRIGNSCLSMAHSDFYSAHPNYKTRLVLNVRDSNGSVLGAAAAALDLLQDVKVDAIIGPQTSPQANFVMDLGDKADVPIISFSATSPSLVPRTSYFVQTAQSDADQVQTIASVVKAFQWSQVVLIYEDTEFGNGIIPYLSNALQDVNARVSYRSVFPKSASDDFISKELLKMMTLQTRVFVVHVTQSFGTRLFLQAREVGMMSDGYAWIATSELTDLFNLMDFNAVEAMQGVLGVKPLIPKSEKLQYFTDRLIRTFLLANQDMNMRPSKTSIFGLWAYDTLWALAMAAERVGNSTLYATKNETNVDSESGNWFALESSETGPKILKEFSKTRFTGLAGEFNLVNGQLEQTPYQIVNVVGSDEKEVGIWTLSGGISKELNLNITTSYSISKENFKSIIWPGDSIVAPRGWEVPLSGKKLRIGVPRKPGFNEFLKVEDDPMTNAITVSGYYKEVFDSVMAALPYAIPYEYTKYPFFNADGSSAGCYDDLVYQVSLQENYDAALGDITITSNRSMYADFTLPFAEGGITSMVLVKYEDVHDIFTFLQPLTKELWLATATFYISTALAIWVLGNRIITSSRDSPCQHAGMFGYFPFFPGEGINGNLLCLVLVTWAFVASLLNSTYTASLSSRLTAQRLLPTVTDVTKLIKSGDYVGCQEGSFLVNFLIKSGFDEKKIRTYKTSEDCYEALELGSKSGGISAYYDVLPHIKMLVSQSCGKYMMVGPTYRTDGFAFAFPKSSPIVADISRAIIQLTEKGTILEIEQRVSSNASCSGQGRTSSPTSITLRSFVVFFAITGFVTLTCLFVSLLMYLAKNRAFLQRISGFNPKILSRVEALRKYFRKSNFSSRPTTTNPRDQIP